MKISSFKKSVLISLLGHITLFSIFSFSFGNRIPPANYSAIYSWGSILKHYDFFKPQVSINVKTNKVFPFVFPNKTSLSLAQSYLKPPVNLALRDYKIIYQEKSPPLPPPGQQRKSVVMFHPVLPYHFALYFKDRQIAHMELIFRVISSGKRNSIVIKRKISSGNLEADLLSMRYISHYLFIQQARLTPDQWQSVKIELSCK